MNLHIINNLRNQVANLKNTIKILEKDEDHTVVVAKYEALMTELNSICYGTK